MFKWLFGSSNKPAEAASGPAELLVIERTVQAPVERAFAVFVDEIASWWPREYTWAKDNLEKIGIEAKIDGHCYERRKDGSMSVWGTVLTVARPEHIVFSWQIDPNRSPVENVALASRVDVRFVAASPETTNIVLVHRDFPRHGPGWQKYRSNMASRSGWPALLDRYEKSAKLTS
jgi:uncharacterized protein YndB with AHSA1/START domain